MIQNIRVLYITQRPFIDDVNESKKAIIQFMRINKLIISRHSVVAIIFFMSICFPQQVFSQNSFDNNGKRISNPCNAIEYVFNAQTLYGKLVVMRKCMVIESYSSDNGNTFSEERNRKSTSANNKSNLHTGSILNL
jgi:hypothetical protein